MKRYLTLCLVATLSCERGTSPLERNVNEVPVAEIISVTLEGARMIGADNVSSIPADGKSTLQIVARIPRKSSTRLITFKTTAGLFLESAAKEVVIRATNDSLDENKAVARVTLQSDTSNATAYVRATVSEYYELLTIRFVKP